MVFITSPSTFVVKEEEVSFPTCITVAFFFPVNRTLSVTFLSPTPKIFSHYVLYPHTLSVVPMDASI
jgi:hypothetical protein